MPTSLTFGTATVTGATNSRVDRRSQRDRIMVELLPGRYIHPPDASTVAPVR